MNPGKPAGAPWFAGWCYFLASLFDSGVFKDVAGLRVSGVAPGPPCHHISRTIVPRISFRANLNERGQRELSFGWRAARVMSLRGFQLFHLRSKRRKRLLLFFFALTFSTLTSFDGGRRGERLLESGWSCLSRLSHGTKAMQFFSLFPLCFIKGSSPSCMVHQLTFKEGEEGNLSPDRWRLWFRETSWLIASIFSHIAIVNYQEARRELAGTLQSFSPSA